MAQARRTGQKNRRNKRTAKPKTRSSQQWGLMFIVLLSGVAIGALLFGYGNFGKGLKNYRDQMVERQQQSNAEQQAAEQTGLVRTEKEFTFYDILEDDIGRVLPENFPVEESARERKKYLYIMQIASFNSREGAEELRARLGLKGFQSVVQSKGDKFRVKMGPYSDRRKLKNARTKIKKAGFNVNPIGIQYRKKGN